MSINISEQFIEHLAETIYGEEYTKHDKQNIKKKYLPIFDKKTNLTIRDIDQSHDFMTQYLDLYNELNNSYQRISSLTVNLRKYKNVNDIYIKENLAKQYHELLNNHKKLKEEIKILKLDKIVEYNTHPYCKKLLDENNTLKNDIIYYKNESKKSNEILQRKIEECEKSRDQYIEDKDKLEDEFRKKESSFIRKAQKLNKEEESVKMKALRDEIASLKQKKTKLEKKNKALKKDNKKLRIQVAEMSSDDSDSDSDSDTD